MIKLFLVICFALLLQSCNSTVPKPETQSSFLPCPTDQHSYKHNCFGSFTYMGGSKYIGEWKDNKRHGNGEYYSGELSNAYNRKFTFKGEWQNDKKHGGRMMEKYRTNDGKTIVRHENNKVHEEFTLHRSIKKRFAHHCAL